MLIVGPAAVSMKWQRKMMRKGKENIHKLHHFVCLHYASRELLVFSSAQEMSTKIKKKQKIICAFYSTHTCGLFRRGHLKLHATHLGLWVTKSLKQTCLSLHLTLSQFALSTNQKKKRREETKEREKWKYLYKNNKKKIMAFFISLISVDSLIISTLFLCVSLSFEEIDSLQFSFISSPSGSTLLPLSSYSVLTFDSRVPIWSEICRHLDTKFLT